MSSTCVAAADWLGSRSIFYNLKAGRFGTRIFDATELDSIEIDKVGLGDYLRFGYSVFGNTPIKDVKFLRPNEQLMKRLDGKLEVLPGKNDKLENWRGKETPELEALERFYAWKPSMSRDEVEILPLSGGLDSRMLLLNRLHQGRSPQCFTYGTSRRQHDSSEIATARRVASKAEVRWEKTDLTGFHEEIDWWLERFGPSVHLHGMYQARFYRKIAQQIKSGVVLSGIVGDLWAGSVECQTPNRPEDLIQLGLSRGISVDGRKFSKSLSGSNLEAEYGRVREQLKNPLDQIVYLVQTKMILLSYLLTVPKHFGLDAQSPFTEIEIALSFSTVKPNRRKGRRWLFEHLDKEGYGNKMNVDEVSHNYLDLGELQRSTVKPLDPRLLEGIVKPEFVSWINSRIRRVPLRDRMWLRFVETRRILPTVGRAIFRSDQIDAYNSYLCLRPLQELLILQQKSSSEG